MLSSEPRLACPAAPAWRRMSERYSHSSSSDPTQENLVKSCDQKVVPLPPDDLGWLRESANRMSKKFVMHVKRLTPSCRGYSEFGSDPVFDAGLFASRFVRRAKVTPCAVFLAFFYLSRILKKHPKLRVTSNNASRLILVASSCAAKFVDDQALRYTNKHWVHLGGGWLTLDKFNRMETEFLGLMGFDLAVDIGEFSAFCAKYGAPLHRIPQLASWM